MTNELPKRDMKTSLLRGFSRKCPNCGTGEVFDGYLKVHDHCPSCNEDLTHQRADDGPAWATMLVTGHMLPPMVMGIYEGFDDPNPFVVAIALCAVFIALTLILLPRIKGMFIAIQWRNYMYGFDPRKSQKDFDAIQDLSR